MSAGGCPGDEPATVQPQLSHHGGACRLARPESPEEEDTLRVGVSARASRAGLLGALLVTVGLGLGACGGATTNGVRSGTTPYGGAALGMMTPEPPPARIAGGPMWFSTPTTLPRSGAPSEVVHLAIENVNVAAEGTQTVYVGPSKKVGAPSLFSARAHSVVEVIVANHDTGPHSFTSSALGLNVEIPASSTKIFRFETPASGRYHWHCDAPCGGWVMSHEGYMQGYVTVVS